MENDRLNNVEQLYHVALELDQSDRTAFLAKACGANDMLRHEVESLLAEAGQETSFLEVPAVDLSPETPGGGIALSPIPASIGRFRLLKLLGEGGMGAVYEAAQDQPRRTVALKVIRPGLASAEMLRRFEDEAHALGRLQHPGIAQIYEAGTADAGFGPQPYFAMELIRGRSLLEYAAKHQLKSGDRLALIAKICDSVEHAHQRGVIHRDLKPGNILVDEAGQPKILDFGVARVTDRDVQHTRQTDLGQLVGTLAYMSPEQVLGDPSALDFRSDVYALGVMLYELLAGKLPYDISRKPLAEAVGTIREQEPGRLSSIDRRYRGDIETIVAKALEKDKVRRYNSAAELAEDMRRYLAHRPITARPASATYQLQKFARRHKALVAGTAAVFLVLTAGVVASMWEALRARKAEAVSEAVNNFLQNDLLAQASSSKQAGPNTKPDPDLKVRTALDRAASRISGKFDKQHEVEAAIRDTIGQTYAELGLYAQARNQFERALELQRRARGAGDPKTLRSASRLGRTLYLQGQIPAAEALLSRTLQTQHGELGPEHPDTLYSMNALASIYRAEAKYSRAEDLSRQVLEVRRRVLGPEHPDTLASMLPLAIALDMQRKYPQAEALFRQAMNIGRRVWGIEHPNTLMSMNNLAILYADQGQYAQAEALHSEALAINRRVEGPEHPNTLKFTNNLAVIYADLGKYTQAEELFTQVLAAYRRVLGPEHQLTLTSMHNVAAIYADQGKYPQAEELFSKTLRIQHRVFGADHPITLSLLSDVAFMYQRQGEYALAESYATQVLAGERHASGSDDVDTMISAADLALAYVSQRKFPQSEPLAREALDFYRKGQSDDWQRFRAESLLGASLAGQKKYAEAEPLLLEGFQAMVARKDRIPAPEHYHLECARQWIIQLYKSWGRPADAAKWRAGQVQAS